MRLKPIKEISQIDINHVGGGEEALNADGIVKLMDKYCPKPNPYQEFFTPMHVFYTITVSVGAGIALLTCGVKRSNIIRRLLKVKSKNDVVNDAVLIELGHPKID